MDLHVSLIGRTDLTGEIYRQLRGAIRDGRLRRGDRLPPTRELARRLNVSRTTVTVAYERLMGEGFLIARVGAGTFVSDQISAPASRAGQRHVNSPLRARPFWEAFPPFAQAFIRPAEFDFRSGLPDASLFPYEEWRRAVAQQLHRAPSDRGVYGPPAGHQGLRDSIARHIGTSRGVQTGADDVTVTNGTQQALDVVARVLLAPGDRVAIEAPGYSSARVLFESLGARVIGVRVDEAGLVADALPRQTRLVYVTPSHQYPLGVSMTLRRRAELLAWADRHDAAIIEDDYDSEFRFRGRPIEPLQTLDTSGRVIYVGSFSKTMLPTLRLGFAVTPPSLTRAVHAAKYVTDSHTALPLQAALARFIDDGSFARHIRKMNVVYQTRHELIGDLVARLFGEYLELIPSVVGLHVTALARRHTTEQLHAVVRRASEMSVEVQELATFAVGVPTHVGLVLGYGAIPTASIAEGLRRLRSCFDADR